jgi:hypothetical protein
MKQMTITIELTQGRFTQIDDIDADLAKLKWYAVTVHGSFYAVRHSARPNRAMVYLHRIILERMIGRSLTKTEFTDHINGNPLDNRRANLRLATNTENMRNRGKYRTNTSGYKGVDWRRGAGKWRAVIKVNGKQIYLGLFTTPELAHAAYCEAAKKYHGEFANTGDN